MAYWNKLRENKGPAQTQAVPARDLNGEQNDMFIHSRVVESTSSIDFTSCIPQIHLCASACASYNPCPAFRHTKPTPSLFPKLKPK